jgi:hypothetical protein
MDYLIARWDAADTPSLEVEQKQGGVPDGMLSGPQHAMDGDQGGTCSWLGSMYLGALAAAAQMATIQGDAASATRYRQILSAGSKNQDKALFNGEYYAQVPDPTPRQDYLTGCYIDQLLGQWWAMQIGCGWLYPAEHVRSAMAALFKYNFHSDLKGFQQSPRKFCEETDAGMQQGTWPRGGKPEPPHVIQNTSEIMSGFEYSAAGMMLYAGLTREAFVVLRAAADRYDGRLRTGLSGGDYTAWGYSGNPFGDDECGKFYARAMAIWTILLACQGFSYDGPAGKIGFAPLWKPEDHVSFFTAAEGWGLFLQKRTAAVQQETIELHYGRLRLDVLVFRLPAQMQTAGISVTLDGKPLAAVSASAGGELRVKLDRPVVLQTKDKLQVRIDLQPSERVAGPESQR